MDISTIIKVENENELNIKIAQLKELKPYLGTRRHKHRRIKYWMIVKEVNAGGYSGRRLMSCRMPDWRHNISDAWELFLELPDKTKITKNLCSDGTYDYWLENPKYNLIIGSSAPEAICKAYIAYKNIN